MIQWIKKMAGITALSAVVLLTGASSQAASTLASPAKGGVDGKPINLLVISSEANKVALIDPVYAEALKKAGYNLHVLSQDDKLTEEYLIQFGAVVVSNLPREGQEYEVYGYRTRFLEANLKLLQKYVGLGGGLIVMSSISALGEAYGDTYEAFLKPWGAKYLIQQLKDGNSKNNEMGPGAYGVGSIVSNHAITSKLKGKKVLYPMNVLRWDNAYSCTPILASKDWTPLAKGDNAKSYMAVNNSCVGESLTDNSTLYAVRKAGKGMVAVSAIHSYYTLTMVSSKEDNVGENGTGVIDFKVMHGEKEGRPSCFGALLDNTFRVFAANSAKAGIGAWKDIAKPAVPPLPTSAAVIDWKTQKLPPTWAHRVIPSDTWPRTYDELPDPNTTGKMKYWKMLIGVKTRYSSGKGTVKAYKAAAIKAGYSAICFTETFEELSPKMWEVLLEDCKDNTDENFVCLPGIDIESTEGQRYLVLGADRFPDPSWLTADGKRLSAIRMLSLGWYGHLSVVHKPEKSPLNSKTYKHYTGIGVATYNSAGKQIDNGMYAYRWAQSVDSGAVPIAVHEVTRPADVEKATKGFQQILPSPTLAAGVKYFRFGFAHNFDAPMRYFISEGPILDGWSLFNKDKGKAEQNRTKFRMQVGVHSEDGTTPITSIKLFDEFDLVRNWQNTTPDFKTVVDGTHNKQHCFILEAQDAKGRRVLSPLMRTVSRNWRLRCGDKQNWLGSQLIYTGWWLNGLPGYNLKVDGSDEGNAEQRGVPILDFPFFSDHAQVNEADMGFHYARGERKDVAGDGKGMLPMLPNEVVDGKIRYTVFTDLKQKDFAVMLVETTITLKKEAKILASKDGLNPQIGAGYVMRWNNDLILPGGKVDKLGKVIDHKTKKTVDGNKANLELEIPVGAYVGGIVPLTEGLHLNGRQLGFSTAPGVYPAGTSWTVRYLMLRNQKFFWKTNRCRGFNAEIVDNHAEQAMNEMGFRGKIPYTLKLNQGKLEKTAYFAHLAAQNGGVAGKNENKSGKHMLMYVPMLITGLDADSEMVLWRSDSKYLEAFAAYEGEGYLSFNADKNVDFYVGNIAVTDAKLAVSIVTWSKDEAHFKVHNPTHTEITSDFATVAAIKGFKPLKIKVTVPAGATVEVK